MMSRHYRWMLAGVIGLTIGGAVVGQEPQPAAEASLEEPTYFDLRRSKDRLTQQLAERYFNLVKLQEWSSASGTKINAKYVSHDPALKWVKLARVTGSGKDRVTKELSVDISKLSKTCQSRVKQIATLQKKLDELAAAETTAEPGQAEAGRLPEGDIGAPMVDERGVEPSARRPVDAYSAPAERGASSERPRSLSETPATVADDPDPLGFGEIPPSAAPVVAGPSVFISAGPALGAIGAEDGAHPKEWATNYDAFRANFTVTADERGETRVDFGQLVGLARAAEFDSARSGEAGAEAGAPPKQSIGVVWEGPFQEIRPTEGGTVIAFDLPELPAPLQLEFRLDLDKETDRSTREKWSTFSPGDRLRFRGRLEMAGPTSIVVNVYDPELVQAAPSETTNEDSRR